MTAPRSGEVRDFLGALPDAKLTEALRKWPGRRRDDYPVTALWGVDDGNVTGAERFHAHVGLAVSRRRRVTWQGIRQTLSSPTAYSSDIEP